MKNRTHHHHLLLVAIYSGIAIRLLGQATNPAPAPTTKPSGESEQERIVLEPFVVSENDATGYAANSTLAGTRINTELRDIGASISIVTAEFLQDTASNNLGQLLSMTTGTEIGGIEGNFAGGSVQSARPDQSEARENPQNNQRVRGVGPASTTQDFFLTDIPFDSYNSSRVTISRGPNSLLFGIGNPAGIIDATLIKAQTNRNRDEVATRFGSCCARQFSKTLQRPWKTFLHVITERARLQPLVLPLRFGSLACSLRSAVYTASRPAHPPNLFFRISPTSTRFDSPLPF